MLEETPPTPQPTPQQMAILMQQVYALVRACPEGRVTTYGWIGKTLGFPRAGRMIGFIMRDIPKGVPAQRVINSKGELSGSKAFGQIGRMRQLLEQEGIIFSKEGRVDLKQYGWDPSQDLSEEERQHILATAPDTVAEPDGPLMQLLLDDSASPFKAR
jgi:methylated-DNA-protein-cysteine methyltransferase-like protein